MTDASIFAFRQTIYVPNATPTYPVPRVGIFYSGPGVAAPLSYVPRIGPAQPINSTLVSKSFWNNGRRPDVTMMNAYIET